MPQKTRKKLRNDHGAQRRPLRGPWEQQCARQWRAADMGPPGSVIPEGHLNVLYWSNHAVSMLSTQ